MTVPSRGALNDLTQLKRQAKELLLGFRRGDPEAVARVQAHFPDPDPERFRLAQAQLVLARSLGFRSWSRLRRAAGAEATRSRPRVRPAEMAGTYVHDVDPVDGERAWRLFRSARDGDREAVRALITEDPKLVHAQYWYTQPVHLAAFANRPDVMRDLFRGGAEPGRTRWAGGWKKLVERAEQFGFDDVLRVTTEAAAERLGYHPDFHLLRDAIKGRDLADVECLLTERPELAAAADIEGNNAVHWAVMTRQPDLLAPLVARGARPDHPRGDGETPAHLLYNGDYEFRVWRDLRGIAHADIHDTLEALLAAGATLDLSVAAASGNLEAVQNILARNSRLARQLDSGRRNPLTYAVRSGHTEIVRALLARGAEPSMPEESAPRGWPLWEACSAGRTDLVALLLEHGADPNSAPDSSDSCLGIARARAGTNASDIEELLRAAGARTPVWHMTKSELEAALTSGDAVVDEPWFAEEVLARNDIELATTLLEVDPGVVDRLTGGRLRLGSPEVAITESAVLKLLLERGFDPDRPGWLGKTALHHYAGRGEVDNVLLLLEHGADIDSLEDEYHGTPLAWAAAEGHLNVVRLLLDHGAAPELPREPRAATPLERAKRNGHSDIVELLNSVVEPDAGT